MNNFVDALHEKIALLQDEKEELEDALERVVAKLSILTELIQEEGAKVEAAPATPRKRGRPPKAKPKESDPVWEEASKMEGTDPKVAERLRNRDFSPAPRGDKSYGPGVHVDQKRRTPSPRNSDATVSIEEDTNDVPVSG